MNKSNSTIELSSFFELRSGREELYFVYLMYFVNSIRFG